jgi:hypothetical protein
MLNRTGVKIRALSGCTVQGLPGPDGFGICEKNRWNRNDITEYFRDTSWAPVWHICCSK